MRAPSPHLRSLLNLPATESVRLPQNLRYEGLWVAGKWHWVLWLGAQPIVWNPSRRFGSELAN